MKKINLILLIGMITLLFISSAKADDPPSGQNNSASQEQFTAYTQDSTSDTVCTGDSAECKQRRRCERSRDCFIDKDGDGINDNRCSGLGLGHGNGNRQSEVNRTGMEGKKGAGKGNGKGNGKGKGGG